MVSPTEERVRSGRAALNVRRGDVRGDFLLAVRDAACTMLNAAVVLSIGTVLMQGAQPPGEVPAPANLTAALAAVPVPAPADAAAVAPIVAAAQAEAAPNSSTPAEPAANQDELDAVAKDLSVLMGSGRDVTLKTEYVVDGRNGVQEQTYNKGYAREGDGTYLQPSICKTSYYSGGILSGGRTESAISQLSLEHGKVVCTAIYKQPGAAGSSFGPYEVARLGNGIAFRNTFRRAPFYFGASEFYRNRDGRLVSVRRYATNEPPDYWHEVEPTNANASAAAK